MAETNSLFGYLEAPTSTSALAGVNESAWPTRS
jgi:hypothetical protein